MIEQYTAPRTNRRRIVAVLTALAVGSGVSACQPENQPVSPEAPASTNGNTISFSTAQAVHDLGSLAIKGRAPMTGYGREKFSNGWASVDGCDTRDIILKRDLTQITLATDGCEVRSGRLQDPYTGSQIDFVHGVKTSSAVQIDHDVSVGDAWQTGAQLLEPSERKSFYNDPLNLLAVDGRANEQKGDGDAASWLPANKGEHCRYIARQILVKLKYGLWVTPPEHDAMNGVLSTCQNQTLSIAD
ncbi:MAG TPA: HNH endonuclease family protein [Candidatus Saccharimonadales bacterium]|jgi:hypothetical protein|nr:HNH endonuclease family protein [Candidatus Saccharimonadales bacterium]